MRDPQFYASALSRAAEDIGPCACEHAGPALCLRCETEVLASRWQEVSIKCGSLKRMTWQLIGPCFPEPDPSHPAFARLLENMRRNDVT